MNLAVLRDHQITGTGQIMFASGSTTGRSDCQDGRHV